MITLVTAAFLAVGPGLVNAHGETVMVVMGEYDAPQSPMFYEPAAVTLEAGQTVRWTNAGTVMHEVEFRVEERGVEAPTAISLADPANPPELTHVHLAPGESFEYTFNEAGVYEVNCNLGGGHAAGKMVIIVA